MSYSLPILPYTYKALEPYLDAQTMELHLTKHHQTYVDKLNLALAPFPNLLDQPIETLLKDLSAVPDTIRTAVKNHGGGHANHSLFWTLLTPPKADTIPQPDGELKQAILTTYGSFAGFQTKFTETAAAHFGSGWAWLVKKPTGTLDLYSLPNQDSPLSQGDTPLLALDVWEHAYYLKYQNRRADYIAAFWHLINWDQVTKYYRKDL